MKLNDEDGPWYKCDECEDLVTGEGIVISGGYYSSNYTCTECYNKERDK